MEMALRRDSPLPWGQALEVALRDYPVIWSDFHATLVSKGSEADHSLSSIGQVPVAPIAPLRLDKPSKPSTEAERGRVATCVVDNKGNKICKAFNDRRGCSTPCSKGLVHCCDVQLASNKTCGGRHSRTQHDPSVHGNWALRPN